MGKIYLGFDTTVAVVIIGVIVFLFVVVFGFFIIALDAFELFFLFIKRLIVHVVHVSMDE